MKRIVAIALVGLVLFSVVCFFPRAADARDSAECYRNHSTCRAGAFGMDVGWIRTTLLLTVCDVGLGRCLLTA
jgi:hypothetical protein